jgi:peptidoglycan hydrolase-like protein with peptidoglycan-binding domain
MSEPGYLVRELQRELKRVGCYYQEIDGEWGQGTRRAMKDFLDRVNASLPLERPDPVLLTLITNQPKTVCGKACPAGEDLVKDNRCLPRALLKALPSPPMGAQSALVRTNAARATSVSPS